MHVTITHDAGSSEGELFRARANGHQALGRTAGEALDGLRDHLPAGTTVVLVQRLGGDQFFGAEDINRLQELMARWRQARDSGNALPIAEQEELESLIEAELSASAQRSAALGDQVDR
jgi:hypothetical protein